MINSAKALSKSKGKNEKRYGLSLVVDLSENKEVKNIVSIIKSKISKKIEDSFVWIDEESYHITLLRCKSISSDFIVTTESREFINDIFMNKYAFSISASTLQLDVDGVIRLYLGEIPSCFYSDVDMDELSLITGLKYKLINIPWITIAYIKPEQIEIIANNFKSVAQYLEREKITFQLNVDRVTLVKYSDNAFRIKKTISNVELRDCYD